MRERSRYFKFRSLTHYFELIVSSNGPLLCDGVHMSIATLDSIEHFCVGDVVTLKVGGSRMTVTAVVADGVLCQWFDEHGEFRQETFDRAALGRQPRSIPPGLVQVRRYATSAAGAPFPQSASKATI